MKTRVGIVLLLLQLAPLVAQAGGGRLTYAPVPVAHVQVLRTFPNRPYTVIATLIAQTPYPGVVGFMSAALRQQAAQAGADAIIVYVSNSRPITIKGTAIKWR